jgi:hypothetical protein
MIGQLMVAQTYAMLCNAMQCYHDVDLAVSSLIALMFMFLFAAVRWCFNLAVVSLMLFSVTFLQLCGGAD